MVQLLVPFASLGAVLVAAHEPPMNQPDLLGVTAVLVYAAQQNFQCRVTFVFVGPCVPARLAGRVICACSHAADVVRAGAFFVFRHVEWG